MSANWNISASELQAVLRKMDDRLTQLLFKQARRMNEGDMCGYLNISQEIHLLDNTRTAMLCHH